MGVNQTTDDGYKKDEFFLPMLQERFVAYPDLGIIKNKKSGNIVGTPPLNKYGSMGIRHDGKVIFFNTHKVMWLLCKGLIPVGYVINHKDGIKSNTKLDNLEIVLENDNRIHAKENGLLRIGPTPGSLNGNSKFSVQDVIDIRTKLSYCTVTDIANEYGVIRQTIGNIKNNKTYKSEIYYP